MAFFTAPKSFSNPDCNLAVPTPLNQNSEVAAMLSNVAKSAPKSLDLIIDTPDFHDFANVDKALILPQLCDPKLENLPFDKKIE